MFQHDIEWLVESSRYLFYFLPQKTRTFTEKSRMDITKKDQKEFFFVFLTFSVYSVAKNHCWLLGSAGAVADEDGDPFGFLERLQDDFDHDGQRGGQKQADDTE